MHQLLTFVMAFSIILGDLAARPASSEDDPAEVPIEDTTAAEPAVDDPNPPSPEPPEATDPPPTEPPPTEQPPTELPSTELPPTEPSVPAEPRGPPEGERPDQTSEPEPTAVPPPDPTGSIALAGGDVREVRPGVPVELVYIINASDIEAGTLQFHRPANSTIVSGIACQTAVQTCRADDPASWNVLWPAGVTNVAGDRLTVTVAVPDTASAGDQYTVASQLRVRDGATLASHTATLTVLPEPTAVPTDEAVEDEREAGDATEDEREGAVEPRGTPEGEATGVGEDGAGTASVTLPIQPQQQQTTIAVLETGIAGSPIGGASVTVTDAGDGDYTWTETTGTNGLAGFIVPNDVNLLNVSVTANGYEPNTGQVEAGGSTSIPLTPGLDFGLQILGGDEASSAPLGSVTVALTQNDGDYTASGVTSGDGWVTFYGVPRGEYTAEVTDPPAGYVSNSVDFLLPLEGDAVTLFLPESDPEPEPSGSIMLEGGDERNVSPGDTVTLTYDIEARDVAGDVVWFDGFPSSSIFIGIECSDATVCREEEDGWVTDLPLAGGDYSGTVTVTVEIPQGAEDSYTIDSGLYAPMDGGSSSIALAEHEATLMVVEPDPEPRGTITLDGDADRDVVPGEDVTLTYTITARDVQYTWVSFNGELSAEILESISCGNPNFCERLSGDEWHVNYYPAQDNLTDTITVRLTVPEDAEPEDSYTIDSELHVPGELHIADEHTATLTVVDAPDLTVEVDPSEAQVVAGGSLALEYTVTGTAPVGSTYVFNLSDLDAWLGIAEVTNCDGDCTLGGEALTLTADDNGEINATVDVSLTMSDTVVPGDVLLTGIVTGFGLPDDGVSGTATITVMESTGSITLVGGDERDVLPGDTVTLTYEIEASNVADSEVWFDGDVSAEIVTGISCAISDSCDDWRDGWETGHTVEVGSIADTITVTLAVPEGAEPEDSYTITSDLFEPNGWTSLAEHTATLTVVEPSSGPDGPITLVGDADRDVVPGEVVELQYSIDASNLQGIVWFNGQASEDGSVVPSSIITDAECPGSGNCSNTLTSWHANFIAGTATFPAPVIVTVTVPEWAEAETVYTIDSTLAPFVEDPVDSHTVTLTVVESEPATGSAEITVETSDSSDIPEGTEVCLNDDDIDCETVNDEGIASFADVPTGDYTVSANVPAGSGYTSDEQEITVEGGETATATLTLTPIDVEPDLTVTPNPAAPDVAAGDQFNLTYTVEGIAIAGQNYSFTLSDLDETHGTAAVIHCTGTCTYGNNIFTITAGSDGQIDATMQVRLNVAADAGEGSSFSLTGTVSGPGLDDDVSGTATITVVMPIGSLSLVEDDVRDVLPGEEVTLTYELEASNLPDLMSGDALTFDGQASWFILTDIDCSDATLCYLDDPVAWFTEFPSPDGSYTGTVTVTVTVPMDATAGTDYYVGTDFAFQRIAHPRLVLDEHMATLTVVVPDLTLQVEPAAAEVAPGGELDLSYTVTGTAPEGREYDFALSDLDAALGTAEVTGCDGTCTFGGGALTLSADSEGQINATVNVTIAVDTDVEIDTAFDVTGILTGLGLPGEGISAAIAVTVIMASGDVAVTLGTEDGDAVPEGTTLCIAGDCQTVTNAIASMVQIDTDLPVELLFAGLPVGEQVVTVRDATPYENIDDMVVVEEDAVTALALTLQLPPPGGDQSGSLTIKASLSDHVDDFVFEVHGPFTSADVDDDEAGPLPGRAFDLYPGESATQSPAFSGTTSEDGVLIFNAVPEGTHTLVDRVTLLELEITIERGVTTSVVFIAPLTAGSGDADVASLAVNTFVTCSIDQIVSTGSVYGGPNAGDGVDSELETQQQSPPGAGPGQQAEVLERGFALYFGSDTNAQPMATFSTDGGSETINDLGTGSYTLVDLGTSDQFQVNLVAGEFGVITIFYPCAIFGPSDPTDPSEHIDDSGTEEPQPVPASPDADDPARGGGDISQLPGTGTGASREAVGATAWLLVLAALLSLGALGVRRWVRPESHRGQSS